MAYYNPKPTLEEAEEAINPLRKYRHLIPTSCSHFIPPLNFHLFASNISILHPNEDAEALRLIVARKSDQALNPFTLETDTRHLFYAALVSLHRVLPDVETLSPRLLIKGPAVPYFSPMIPDPKNTAEKNKISSFSTSSAGQRHRDEESEIKEVKEKAIVLLMGKLDREVHGVIGLLGGGEVEVWEAKGWKFAPAPVPVKEEAENSSVKSGAGGRAVGKRDSNWFSKS